MSELSKIIPHRYFSIRVKLSAIRDRLFEELQKYNISFPYCSCFREYTKKAN